MPGPTDAWTTLAGLARETSRIRLGTLVTAGHLPAARPAGDQRRAGRPDERRPGRARHRRRLVRARSTRAYGIPFPPLGERFDRLEEQLAVITGLWATPAGEPFDYAGEHYPVTRLARAAQAGAAAAPADPARRDGPKRTPRLAARYADEFNLPFASVDGHRGAVRPGPRGLRRDRPGPGRDVWSNALVLCCGRDDAEVARRAAAIGRDPDELRANGLAGTPAEVLDTIGRYAEIGSERLYLQVLDLGDLDHLELVASEVMAKL